MMNELTPHIVDDEERFLIASRSPINVFVPTLSDHQHVSDRSGNYWPYRTASYQQATEDKKATIRTIKRTLKFRLTDNRPAGHNFHTELYGLADEIHADQVLPIVHTGVSRDAIYYPVSNYDAYDFSHQPKLITPIPEPYEFTSACIKHSLYGRGSGDNAISRASHPTNFALRGLEKSAKAPKDLKSFIETAKDATNGDANIHLHKPTINGSLVQFIRENRMRINSVTIPQNATEYINCQQTSSKNFLSKDGTRDLSSELCPYVRIATELSLLSSSYIDRENLFEAIKASSIPTSKNGIEIGKTQRQQKLTSGQFS